MQKTCAKVRYLLAMHHLAGQHPQMRSIDIARSLGVTRVSVNRMLHQLQLEGLVQKARYGQVALSDAGRTLACRLAQEYQCAYTFLLSYLDVPQEDARRDAMVLVASLCPDTLSRIQSRVQGGGPRSA
nr:metal-dependent transcriptional regulator [Maliibacterium massiliense]